MEELKTKLTTKEEVDYTDLIKGLLAHDAEITMLTKTTESLKVDINGISNKIDAFHSELTRLLSRPQLSISNTLSTAKDIGIMVGLAVSCIVYVASTALESRIVLLEEKQKASIERVTADIKRLEEVKR